MILSCILIFLAAIFNAVMDKTKDTIQYESSMFYVWGWNPKFWNDEAWEGKFLPLTEYKANAWHISKSLMLLCLFIAVSKTVLEFAVISAIWLLVFNRFYNKLLKK